MSNDARALPKIIYGLDSGADGPAGLAGQIVSVQANPNKDHVLEALVVPPRVLEVCKLECFELGFTSVGPWERHAEGWKLRAAQPVKVTAGTIVTLRVELTAPLERFFAAVVSQALSMPDECFVLAPGALDRLPS